MQHFGAKPSGAEFFSFLQSLAKPRNTAIALA